MEISKISLNNFLLFYRSVYKDDSNFKDNKTGIIKIVCGEKRPFYAYSKQEIIAVAHKDKTLCACVLIIHKNAPNMLSIAFFESLPECENAVNMLIEYAMQYGKQNNCSQMVVSLDGHGNNSVSFPAKDGTPAFGESYCPQYYHSYFKDFDKIKFTSFYDDVHNVKQRVAKDLPKLEQIKEHIALEYADFGSGFTKTMERYTDICNRIFANHKHYFQREYSEDFDLFNDMRPLLKKENLIFARCGGKDIGFVLWYPDYNELVAGGKGASVLTVIKYKLFCRNPKTVKVVEVGVDEKYRRYGTVLMLFNEALQSINKNADRILSSWILDENNDSKAITRRYTEKPYKDYYAYEKNL